MSNDKSAKFNTYALLCFVAGLILPAIFIIIGRLIDKGPQIESPTAVLFLILELLAILFASLSWQERSSKVIIAVVTVCLTGLFILLLLPGGSSQPRMRAPEPAVATPTERK